MSAVITSDDTLVIETPERVPLHFALASIGNRFIACAIDHTIQILALITLGIIFAIITDVPNIGSRLMNAPKWVIALLVIIQFLRPIEISASVIWSRGPWSCASAKPKRRRLPKFLLRRFPMPRCDEPSRRFHSAPTSTASLNRKSLSLRVFCGGDGT